MTNSLTSFILKLAKTTLKKEVKQTFFFNTENKKGRNGKMKKNFFATILIFAIFLTGCAQLTPVTQKELTDSNQALLAQIAEMQTTQGDLFQISPEAQLLKTCHRLQKIYGPPIIWTNQIVSNGILMGLETHVWKTEHMTYIVTYNANGKPQSLTSIPTLWKKSESVLINDQLP